MKKLGLILLAATLLLTMTGSLVSCGEPEPDEPVVLKMASAATGNYQPTEQAFCDAFNARCGPDYTIEYFGAEAMLTFPELLDGVRTGAADMGVITPNFYSFDEPKLGAVEMPFLLNNLEAHIYATAKFKPLYGEILENQFNQKLLCLHNYTGMGLIATKPVKTLEDWDGLLVQSISPVLSAMIEALGGSPVSGQPYTESYSLIEKGTVDGVITAPAAMRVFALSDVAKYMTAAYLVPAVHGFSINMDVWNSLPKDIQDAMVEEAEKQSAVIDDWLRGQWEADFGILADAGVEVYFLPQDELARWKEACQPVVDDLMNQYGEFGQKIMDIANEANAKYPN
jgi:TRAP-type C4-dicarboxylate transport system substrate-binding protein